MFKLLKKHSKKVKISEIPTLMSNLASRAWLGIRDCKITLLAGNHIIELIGYIYEPFWEDFSGTAKICLDGECLYGEGSKNVAAYKNQTYHIGKFGTLDKALEYLGGIVTGPLIIKE